MQRPVLYVFTISHYCEKARWALDHHGIGFDLGVLAPGRHVQVAGKLGLARSSLPILVADGAPVQGSARVVDWADATGTGEKLTPEDSGEECRAIEERLDRVAGVHVRRHFYSEALLDQPEQVRPIFEDGLNWGGRLLVRLAWNRVRGVMIGRMDLGPEQRLQSRGIMDGELAWLDGLLADGRTYLIGDRFTRADLAAAALLSPLAGPSEHPAYGALKLPPLFQADMAAWRDRPSLRHARAMYRNHR